MTPTVTRLRHERPGWVAVELDGRPWRVLPAEAVLRAGLSAGVELGRDRALVVARERRRLLALGAAGKALERRELTRVELDERLQRRQLPQRDREAALDAVREAGLQDDGRAARARAESLAARGYGDLAIEDDLRQRGLDSATAAAAIAGLEGEAVRAARIVERDGHSARTAQALTRRGFAEDTIEVAVADSADYG